MADRWPRFYMRGISPKCLHYHLITWNVGLNPVQGRMQEGFCPNGCMVVHNYSVRRDHPECWKVVENLWAVGSPSWWGGGLLSPELVMGWVHPWIGLGWVRVFFNFWWVGLDWVETWKKHSDDFPVLSRVARRVFCISSSSAQSERLLLWGTYCNRCKVTAVCKHSGVRWTTEVGAVCGTPLTFILAANCVWTCLWRVTVVV